MRDLAVDLAWTTFHLRVHDEARAAMVPIEGFFRDAVSESVPAAPHFVVEVSAWDPDLFARASSRGERIKLRRSSAAPFNFDVWRLHDGGRRVYANEATILDVPASCRGVGDLLRLYVSADSCHQVVDNLRDLAWRHEEHCGRVVLHAAGVCRDGRVAVIAGPKGAGKTTTMIAALNSGAWSYFSGDKVVCDVSDDRIVAAPWPDWPYVGVGTIRTSPTLEERVRADDPAFADRAPHEKLLLDPGAFSRWYPAAPLSSRMTLAALVLPAVAPGEGISIRRVVDQAEKEADLLRIVDRTSDTTFFAAQLHLVPSYARMHETLDRMRPLLEGIEVTEVAGDIDKFAIDDVVLAG